jgi:hypothetical protein
MGFSICIILANQLSGSPERAIPYAQVLPSAFG